jgi:hypothetical protein
MRPRTTYGILAATAYALIWFAGTVGQGQLAGGSPFPRPTDGMPVAQRFFAESGAAVQLNAGLQMLAAIALLVFAASMTALLWRNDRVGAAALVLAGGAVSTGLLMMGAAVLSTLGTPEVTTDPALTWTLNQISFWLGGPLHVAALGITIAGAARGLTGMVPRWLSASGLVVGGIGVLAALTGLVPALAVCTLAGRFLGFAWLLAAAALLVRAREPFLV